MACARWYFPLLNIILSTSFIYYFISSSLKVTTAYGVLVLSSKPALQISPRIKVSIIIKLAWYKACDYSNRVCWLAYLNHATWIVRLPFTTSNRACLPSTRGLGSISISISGVPIWRNDRSLRLLSALAFSRMTSFSAILAPPRSRIGQNPAQTVCYRPGDWEAPMNPRSARCSHLRECRCLDHFSTLTTTNIDSLKTRPMCLARQRQRPGQPQTLSR